NWDLSTARATRVVDYLIHAGEIDPVRLSAAGYSEFRPLVPNDSPANRARNRRTDIVILNTATRKAEEPAGRGPADAGSICATPFPSASCWAASRGSFRGSRRREAPGTVASW